MRGVLQPYKGEYIHGVVARHAQAFGGEGKIAKTRQAWLGIHHASQYGPCSIGDVAALTTYGDANAALTNLRDNHSLAPFASLFLPGEQREHYLQAFIARNSGYMEIASEVHIVPIMGRDTAPGLRFCGVCAEIDRGKVGRPYWWTEHQGPATAICLWHNEWLRRSERIVRGELISGPDSRHLGQTLPLGHGKIPKIIRSVALAEAQLRRLAWAPTLNDSIREAIFARLRARFKVRSSRLDYADIWQVFDAEEWRRARVTCWDARLTSIFVLKSGRLARVPFRLGHRAVQATMLIPYIVQLELTCDRLDEIINEMPPPPARYDVEVCGSFLCERYDSSTRERLTKLAQQRTGTRHPLGFCVLCGWRGQLTMSGIRVLSRGSAFYREALRLARSGEYSRVEQAQALRVNVATFQGLWSTAQRRGLTIDGERFPTFGDVARERAAAGRAVGIRTVNGRRIYMLAKGVDRRGLRITRGPPSST